MNQQLERIRTIEQALNEVGAAVTAMDAALTQYRALLPKLRLLEEYCESPLWQEDYDADQAGKLPDTLCRSVLSQDTLYDLLCSNARLLSDLQALSRRSE